MPAQVYSASLHPNKSTFVAGGEDFKIYKFTYDNGKELGMLISALCKYTCTYVTYSVNYRHCFEGLYVI